MLPNEMLKYENVSKLLSESWFPFMQLLVVNFETLLLFAPDKQYDYILLLVLLSQHIGALQQENLGQTSLSDIHRLIKLFHIYLL